MSLEWMAPAAIIIIFANKFFGTILDEAAKDFYAAMKSRLAKMAKRTCGRERIFDPKVIRGHNSPSEPYSNFSLRFTSKTGKAVVFPFCLNLEPTSYEVAAREFFRLAEDHFRDSPMDPLRELLNLVEHDPSIVVYMRLDVESHTWQPIDTMAEAKKASERQAQRREKG